MLRRRQVPFLAAALLSGAIHAEQDSRLIAIYVPAAPGGPTDLMARTLGDAVATSSGQPVIVENKPGAFGSVAVSALKQAPANTIPLLIGDWAALGSNVALFKALPYNPITDFDPITSLLNFPVVLYVSAGSPYASVESLRRASRLKSISYASQGNGTPGHILGAMLTRKLEADFVHVPYRGSGPAMQELMAGQVALLFDALPAGLPYLREGRIRALAIMADRRSPLLPDVPTAAEVGLQGLEMDVWFGLVARKGLSNDTLKRLNKLFIEALASPAIERRFLANGYGSIAMPANRFGQYMKDELARWSRVIKDNEISAD